MKDITNRYKQFDIIKSKNGITTRLGGVSQGPYSTLNTSFFGDDDKIAVYENIYRVLSDLKIENKTIIATQQVHSNNVLEITHDFDFDNLIKMDTKGSALDSYQLYVASETDGLITCREDVVLMTFYADCVPLVYESYDHKWIGSVHSGWKGTSNLMALEVIDLLHQYGYPKEKINVGIGQCAAVCCYEVDQRVYDGFTLKYSQEQLSQIFLNPRDDKYDLDLKLANRLILVADGVDNSNIETIEDCTICMSELYHSHRRTGYPRGSLSSFISKK